MTLTQKQAAVRNAARVTQQLGIPHVAVAWGPLDWGIADYRVLGRLIGHRQFEIPEGVKLPPCVIQIRGQRSDRERVYGEYCVVEIDGGADRVLSRFFSEKAAQIFIERNCLPGERASIPLWRT